MNQISHSARRAPGSRGPRGKNARGLRTRAALLRAAEELFGVRGYEGTSIVDLTRHAGIALGTFYVHFADKKELFVELVDSLGSRLRRHLAARVAGAARRVEMERRGLEAFLDFVSEHRNMYRIVRQADFVDQACFRRYYRRMAEGYAAGLAAAADKGEIRGGDPEVTCWCLMGIADFLGMRWVLWEKDPRARKHIVADALGFIEAALAPAAGAPPRAPRRGKR
jgi:AcrR family transcriptional regulator